MRCAPMASDSVTVGSSPSRHDRDGDADREEEPVRRRRADEKGDQEEPDADADGDRRDASARRGSARGAAGVGSRAAARVRPAMPASRVLDPVAMTTRTGLALDDEAARVDTVSPTVGMCGHALTGQRRRVDREGVDRLEREIGRDAVARREQHDVARRRAPRRRSPSARPSRTTVTRRGSRSRSRSAACSARCSCTNANTPLSTTTTKMATPS